jgi:hypothetical protein
MPKVAHEMMHPRGGLKSCTRFICRPFQSEYSLSGTEDLCEHDDSYPLLRSIASANAAVAFDMVIRAVR